MALRRRRRLVLKRSMQSMDEPEQSKGWRQQPEKQRHLSVRDRPGKVWAGVMCFVGTVRELNGSEDERRDGMVGRLTEEEGLGAGWILLRNGPQ